MVRYTSGGMEAFKKVSARVGWVVWYACQRREISDVVCGRGVAEVGPVADEVEEHGTEGVKIRSRLRMLDSGLIPARSEPACEFFALLG